MIQYELSRIGQFHINHNEDAKTICELGNAKFLVAVMDGCSMGTESHFASTLIAKIIRKISKEIYYRTFIEHSEKTEGALLEEILRKLFDELCVLKNQLLLEREEILSTLILGVVNKDGRAAELITIGDGLICCNRNLTEYEQDDKPDYLGYHLAEDFTNWIQDQNQRLSLNNIEDLSISTDGIFSFKPFDNDQYSGITESEIIEFLLVNNSGADNENMLRKKLLILERNYGLKPSDDLTIVRFVYH